MKSQYPILPSKASPEIILDWLREVVRLRQTEDLPDFTNLPTIYLQGRSTTRIPSSNSDVLVTDVEGDVVYALNGTFRYTLVDASGTLKWAREALDVAW